MAALTALQALRISNAEVSGLAAVAVNCQQLRTLHLHNAQLGLPDGPTTPDQGSQAWASLQQLTCVHMSCSDMLSLLQDGGGLLATVPVAFNYVRIPQGCTAAQLSAWASALAARPGLDCGRLALVFQAQELLPGLLEGLSPLAGHVRHLTIKGSQPVQLGPQEAQGLARALPGLTGLRLWECKANNSAAMAVVTTFHGLENLELHWSTDVFPGGLASSYAAACAVAQSMRNMAPGSAPFKILLPCSMAKTAVLDAWKTVGMAAQGPLHVRVIGSLVNFAMW